MASELLFRKVIFPDHLPYSLYLHPMPGQYEDMSSFVSGLEKRNIRTIICLTSCDEIARFSPEYLVYVKDETRRCAIEWFPISDFGIPEDTNACVDLARKYAQHLREGEAILVHCRMGIGRTGLFAIVLLMALGIPRIEAEQIIRNAHAAVQTRAQIELIRWAEHILQNSS